MKVDEIVDLDGNEAYLDPALVGVIVHVIHEKSATISWRGFVWVAHDGQRYPALAAGSRDPFPEEVAASGGEGVGGTVSFGAPRVRHMEQYHVEYSLDGVGSLNEGVFTFVAPGWAR